MIDARVHEVLKFWFADTGAHRPTAEDNKRWFGGGEALDREIDEKFSYLLEQPLEGWLDSPKSNLAYVILHDQFPLNIFRRQAKAFSFEGKAEQATKVAIERGFDKRMGHGERVFLYMPLMHSEKLELQELGVQMFERMAVEAEEPLREAAAGTLKYAQEHRDTIARFGRFPFRNQVLGRQSTAEELAYLDGGAPRYGQ